MTSHHILSTAQFYDVLRNNVISTKPLLKWLLLLVVLLQGCASIPPRNPLPAESGNEAQIPGIANARYWGDMAPPYTDAWLTTSNAEIRQRYSGIYGKKHNYLAISGGGANGAFGAGLLVGWSAAGTRPQFTMVTGISTGALSAPFAFLGAEYDDELKEVYTRYSTKDLMTKNSKLKTLTGDSIADTTPLRAMIARYIDNEVVEAIAHEHRKGRILYIGTTNLDAQRPVIWNIGLIAASGMPGARDLIHDIMLASASIPVSFPPVMIEVEANGKRYDEIHVDGGTTNQVFLYPVGLDWRRVKNKLVVKGTPQVYLIRNSILKPKWETVDRELAPIAGRSVSSLIRTQGIGDMYRIYLEVKRDGLDYHLAFIPDEFNLEPQEPFDPVYMGKLFELGYEMAKQGYPWKKEPSGM